MRPQCSPHIDVKRAHTESTPLHVDGFLLLPSGGRGEGLQATGNAQRGTYGGQYRHNQLNDEFPSFAFEHSGFKVRS